MEGWHTEIETPTGTQHSPPADSREDFLALLHRLLSDQPGDERTATITHRRDGHEPVVRRVTMSRLS